MTPIDDQDSELADEEELTPLAPAEPSALLQLFHAAVQRLSRDSKNTICIFLGEYVQVSHAAPSNIQRERAVGAGRL